MNTTLHLRLSSFRYVAVLAACAASLFGCGGQDAPTASATPATILQPVMVASTAQNQMDDVKRDTEHHTENNTVYTVKMLAVTDGSTVGALGFNNRGRVVGTRLAPGDSDYKAAIWDGRKATQWRTFSNTPSVANAINDAGQIVGSAVLPNGSRPVLWHGNTVKDLGTLGGRNGAAFDINKHGHITGYSNTAQEQTAYATLWRGGRIINLGTLRGGNFSIARAINDRGDVAGYSTERADSIVHATLWKDGTAYKLGTPEGGVSEAWAINNHRQVVGFSDITRGAGYPRPMLWENGAMRDLGTLGGRAGRAQGINDAGQIVGFSTTAVEEDRGTLWYRGRVIDLTTLLAPEAQGITITYAIAINESGEILVIGLVPGAPGGGGPLLLTPRKRK